MGQTRTGSNNLVVGDEHEFTSYGGLVAGLANTITGTNASVPGGAFNTASGHASSISGGYLLTQPEVDGWAAGSRGGTVYVGDFESP